MKKGFLFFYNWLEPFKALSGDDFKELFFTLLEYEKNGTKPDKIEGESATIANFIFPQLDRRMAASRAGKKGMEKRWGEKNNSVNNKTIAQRQRQRLRQRQKQDIDSHSDTRETRVEKSSAFESEKLRDMFDLFWERYPKQNCRVRAEKAFIALSPDEDLFDDILFGLDLQLETGKFCIENPRFIPTAAKWLSEKRWTDKIDGEELLQNLYNHR